MEDKVKGYAKLTAALAAVVMPFIAIGVSTTSTVSAQTAVMTITPTSAVSFSAGDTKKNNTICSTTAVPSTCAADDGTFLIAVTHSTANGASTEVDTIEVSVKNMDLAIITPSTSTDSNAKKITLLESASVTDTTPAVNTGIFTRIVKSKHASTGLLAEKPRPLLAYGIASAGSATVVTSLDLNTNVDGQNTNQYTTAVQDTWIGGTICITLNANSAGNAPQKQCRAVASRGGDGSFTVAAFTAAVEANDRFTFYTLKPEVKAFTGNTLTATYSPTGTLGVSKSITVDNVKPSVLQTGPTSDYITKGNTTITFTGDVTDVGAGFPSKSSSVISNANASQKGGIKLYVGTSAVALVSTDLTAITDGYSVSKSYSSNDISNIAAKVPWWIYAEDIAGNSQMSSGVHTSAATAVGNTTTLVDSALAGTTVDDLFNSRTMTRTIGGIVEKKNISDFVASSGTFTTAAFSANSAVGSVYNIINTNVVTVDKVSPNVASAAAIQTGHNWSAAKPAGSRLRTGLFAKNTSIRVTFTDASGLDAATVGPASFSASGNTVEATLLIDVANEDTAAPTQRIPNDVFLTLGTALGSSTRPTVSVNTGTIKDKAGNAVTGASYKATDKLGPGLTLTKDVSLSKKEVKVTIVADEQLLAAPTAVVDNMTSATAGTLSGTAITTGKTITQKGANTYELKQKIAGIKSGAGHDINVYVTANDTSSNPGKAGHATDGTNSAALTFELDQKLNNGLNPKVSVSDKVGTVIAGAVGGGGVSATALGPKVESVDPMIVTVDFNRTCSTAACDGTNSAADGESKEYPRDSYKTVTLTSASLKVIFSDGSYETTTYDIATDITSPDNKRFTLPMSAPKVGKYQLTIKAVDLAGNDNLAAPTATTAQSLKYSWQVTAALPVKLSLSPGWNLISLPFQPANPALNSVIPATHPADIVMTFDNANQIWLVSRRDADTGLLAGDVAVMTSNTAYFVRTDNFQELSVLRPPVATAAAAPPPPPAIAVVPGWNLVPVVSLSIPLPYGIEADNYFGTLQSGANKGWLKAMTFDPLARTWTSVTPAATTSYGVGAINPCTNVALVAADVAAQTEPCQSGAYVIVTANGGFDGSDTVALSPPVLIGKGYWLYATAAGVVIP